MQEFEVRQEVQDSGSGVKGGASGMNDAVVIECDGVPLTPEDIEVSQWGRDAIKNTETALQDGLKQMLVMMTAVFGGSVAFLGSMDKLPRAMMVSAFLVSLGSSVYGFLPKAVNFGQDCLTEMREERTRLIRLKDWCLFVAMVALLVGCAFALVGVIVSQPPPAK